MALSAPKAGGDILGPADILGHLLAVVPTEYRTEIVTKFTKAGEAGSDAIQVDVVVLTAQNQDGSHGVVYRDVLWFNAMLCSSLKKQLGDTVLARMGQGQGKPGQDPPFVLVNAMDDAQAVAFAEDWLAKNPEFELVAARTLAIAQGGAHTPPPAGQPIPGVPTVASSAPATAPRVAAIPAQAAIPSVPGTVAGPNLGANAAVPTLPAPAAAPAVQAAPPVADPAALLAALSPTEQAALAAMIAQQQGK